MQKMFIVGAGLAPAHTLHNHVTGQPQGIAPTYIHCMEHSKKISIRETLSKASNRDIPSASTYNPFVVNQQAGDRGNFFGFV